MTARLKPEQIRARALLRAENKSKEVKVKSAHADAFKLNPKVAWPIAAAALVNIIVEGVKAAGGVDLSSMQADMVLVSMAVVGYLVPSN